MRVRVKARALSPIRQMRKVAEAMEALWSPGKSKKPWGAWPMGWATPAPESSAALGLGLQERWLRGEGGSTRYWVKRPAGREGERLPMALMLHGCKQTAEDFAVGSAMGEIAEREGVILVYPEQDAARAPGRCWRWFEPGHQARGAGEPALMAAIAREAGEEFGADGSRVFIAGLSAGAAMALLAAREYPEVFAAAGCHSGLPPGSASDARSALLAMRKGASEASEASARVPLIVFHGAADRAVAPRNAELCFEALCPDGEERSERFEKGGRSVERRSRWAGGKAVGELWLIEGAGHAWSGGDERGGYADALGPNAAEETLRFFLSQSAAA